MLSLQNYKPPTRPYSRDEISYRHTGLMRALNLSETPVTRRCGHKYLPKVNYQGNSCSVCKQLRDLYGRRSVPNEVLDFLDVYMFEIICLRPEEITYQDLWVERCFYEWLYPRRRDDGIKRHVDPPPALLRQTVSDPIEGNEIPPPPRDYLNETEIPV